MFVVFLERIASFILLKIGCKIPIKNKIPHRIRMLSVSVNVFPAVNIPNINKTEIGN